MPRFAAKKRPGASCSSRRSEEHTSELQSHSDIVCRLLLEKKPRVPTTSIVRVCLPAAAQLRANTAMRGWNDVRYRFTVLMYVPSMLSFALPQVGPTDTYQTN